MNSFKLNQNCWFCLLLLIVYKFSCFREHLIHDDYSFSKDIKICLYIKKKKVISNIYLYSCINDLWKLNFEFWLRNCICLFYRLILVFKAKGTVNCVEEKWHINENVILASSKKNSLHFGWLSWNIYHQR